MKEPIVSFEIAEELRSLGFNHLEGNPYQSRAYQRDNEELVYAIHGNDVRGKTLAPTLSIAQKFLRERYNLHITITSISQESWQWHITYPGQQLPTETLEQTIDKTWGEDYQSYEEALDEGIKHGIKQIKEKLCISESKKSGSK